MMCCVTILLLLGSFGPTCRSFGPEAVVREFFAALNAHEVERALALLDEGYTFRDAAGTFSVPRERIRPMLEWDAATRSRSEATIRAVRADTVVVGLVETNDFLELLEVGPWAHEAKIVVREGRIAATIVEAPGVLGRKVDRALAPVVEWVRETRPERLDGLVTDDRLVYDGDTARRWIRLLREARDVGVIGPGARKSS